MLIWSIDLKFSEIKNQKKKNEVIRIFDQAKEVFTEMEEIELSLTSKEKLKISI